MNLRVYMFGKLKGLLGWYVLLALTGIATFCGVAAMIEMVYHLQLNEAMGPVMRFMGVELDAKSLGSWMGALALSGVGFVLFEITRRRFAGHWGEVQGQIEAAIRAREAA
jgi:branched-chain amino acid transport system permease protein